MIVWMRTADMVVGGLTLTVVDVGNAEIYERNRERTKRTLVSLCVYVSDVDVCACAPLFSLWLSVHYCDYDYGFYALLFSVNAKFIHMTIYTFFLSVSFCFLVSGAIFDVCAKLSLL